MDLARLRNISIIAHIDHGKTTLSDRVLELSGIVSARDMRAQYLDSMDLERERGITIKLQSVRIPWRDHVINLIDTPGHVDFGYEVSRSLAACEGVVLLVDAAQGIEAQTLANCYLALENDLEIIACMNKIDLPAADPDRCAEEIENVLGIPAEEVLRISAKSGEGVPELLDAVLDRIPAPVGEADDPLRALIFDSHFDPYRGVVSSVRIMDGTLRTGAKLRFMQAGATHAAEEIGVRSPGPHPGRHPRPGRDGLPDRRHQGRGLGPLRRDRHRRGQAAPPSRSRATATPSRWCSAVCSRSTATSSPTCARRSRSCGSTTPASPTSRRAPAPSASGSAAGSSACCTWRSCASAWSASSTSASSPPPRRWSTGCTPPRARSSRSTTRRRCRRPPRSRASRSRGSAVTLLTPSDYTGTLMELCQNRRGEMVKLEYLSPERVELRYRLPLAEVVTDFFDQMKSRTQGYASLDYEPDGYDISALVKVDILLNAQPVDAFSMIVHRDKADDYGRRMCEKLKELIPRQLFDVPIQAAIGGPDHLPPDREGQAQGRAGQVLRRRHHPEAQADREAEGGQEEDEVDRAGRGPPGSLRQRPPPRRLIAEHVAGVGTR